MTRFLLTLPSPFLRALIKTTLAFADLCARDAVLQNLAARLCLKFLDARSDGDLPPSQTFAELWSCFPAEVATDPEVLLPYDGEAFLDAIDTIDEDQGGSVSELRASIVGRLLIVAVAARDFLPWTADEPSFGQPYADIDLGQIDSDPVS